MRDLGHGHRGLLQQLPRSVESHIDAILPERRPGLGAKEATKVVRRELYGGRDILEGEPSSRVAVELLKHAGDAAVDLDIQGAQIGGVLPVRFRDDDSQQRGGLDDAKRRRELHQVNDTRKERLDACRIPQRDMARRQEIWLDHLDRAGACIDKAEVSEDDHERIRRILGRQPLITGTEPKERAWSHVIPFGTKSERSLASDRKPQVEIRQLDLPVPSRLTADVPAPSGWAGLRPGKEGAQLVPYLTALGPHGHTPSYALGVVVADTWPFHAGAGVADGEARSLYV